MSTPSGACAMHSSQWPEHISGCSITPCSTAWALFSRASVYPLERDVPLSTNPHTMRRGRHAIECDLTDNIGHDSSRQTTRKP